VGGVAAKYHTTTMFGEGNAHHTPLCKQSL
jgi:hypothetical protein